MIGPWGRPRGIRVSAKNLGEIRSIATRARETLGVNEHPIDMVDLLENTLRRHGIHFHVVENTSILGEAARAIPEKGLILVTLRAYDGIHMRHPEHVLLVPHELGHFALGHAVTFARSMSTTPHGILEDSEIQADQFSHEFLMPPVMVRRHCLSPQDLQRVFGISKKDAEIRYAVLRAEGYLD